jgi:hypothetical protein
MPLPRRNILAHVATPTNANRHEYSVSFLTADYYFDYSRGYDRLADAEAAISEHIASGGHAKLSRRYYGFNGMQYRQVGAVR